MKKLIALVLMVGCGGGGGASDQEAFQAFGAATAAMATAQSKAVSAAQTLVTPADLTLNYTGPCTTGGTVSVTGTYNNAGSGQSAAFDMTTSFDACADAQGVLDGELRWTSVAEGTRYTATMKGDISWVGQGASASCDFDLKITVDGQTVTYGGSICGHDMSKLNGR